MQYQPGDRVHVPGFGTGIVRQARNAGTYVVEIKGRMMVVADQQLSPAAEPKGRRPAAKAAPPGSPDDGSGPPTPTLDLHDYRVEEAIEALDTFLNDALLSGAAGARVIHGRSGGRIKAAVHARLRSLTSVRRFRLDPTNAGVTLIAF